MKSLAIFAWIITTALALISLLIQFAGAALAGDIGEWASRLATNWAVLLAFYAIWTVALFLALLFCVFLSTLSKHKNEIGYPRKWQYDLRNRFERDRRQRSNRLRGHK